MPRAAPVTFLVKRFYKGRFGTIVTVVGPTGTVGVSVSFSTVTVGPNATTAVTVTLTKSPDLLGTSVTVHYAVTGTGNSPILASDFDGAALPAATVTIGVGVASAAVTLTFAAKAAPPAAKTGLFQLSSPTSALLDGAHASFAFTIAAGVIQPPTTHVGVAASFANVTVDPLNQVVANISVGKTGVQGVAATVDWAVTADPSAALPVRAADFAGGVLPGGTLSIGAALASKQISLTFAAEAPPASNRGGIFTLSNPQPSATVDLDQANISFPFIINQAVVVGTSRSGKPWKSGVTVPDNTLPGMRTQLEAFEAYRGCKVDVIGVKTNRTGTWAQLLSAVNSKAGIAAWCNAPTGGGKIRLAFSIPLIPNGAATTLVQAGAATVDADFRATHQACAAAIAGFNLALPPIIRIGREWNAQEFDAARNLKRGAAVIDQSVCWADPSDTFLSYRTAWARCAGYYHAAIPGCLTDWCSLRETKGVNVLNAYPGDVACDTIGADMYDGPTTAPGVTSKAAWLAYRDASIGGPTFWLNFAKSRGKKLAIGELALSTGDHQHWIYGFWHEFMATNAADISHELYFDIQDGPVLHQLNDGTINPNATLEYKTFMTSGGSHFFPSGW